MTRILRERAFLVLALWCAAAAAPGCTEYRVTEEELPPGELDVDGDGWTPMAGDCDDLDPTLHPGQPEICGDGVDNDCDGADRDCGLTGLIDLGDADAECEYEYVTRDSKALSGPSPSAP